jgi:hypothetical protein
MPVQANWLEEGKGWTRHQLGHSALTHLAEAGVSLPLLMTKTRHQHLRSLQEYAQPGAEAVAAVTRRPRPGPSAPAVNLARPGRAIADSSVTCRLVPRSSMAPPPR